MVHSEILNDLKGLARLEKKVILLALWCNPAQAGAGDLDFTPCSKSCHPWALSQPPSVSVGRNQRDPEAASLGMARLLCLPVLGPWVAAAAPGAGLFGM